MHGFCMAIGALDVSNKLETDEIEDKKLMLNRDFSRDSMAENEIDRSRHIEKL